MIHKRRPRFSGVYKNTAVDKNSVVFKNSVEMVDKSYVVAQFSLRFLRFNLQFGEYYCIKVLPSLDTNDDLLFFQM